MHLRQKLRPIGFHEIFRSTRQARSFYLFRLQSNFEEDPPIETRAEDGAIVDGNWRWFTNCPDNLIRISAPWSNILMHKFNSDSLITRFTFNFFDRHTAFKQLPKKLVITHSLSPGEVAFL